MLQVEAGERTAQSSLFDAPYEVVRRLTIIFRFCVLVGDLMMDEWSTGSLSGGDVRVSRGLELGSPGRQGVDGVHINVTPSPASPPSLGLVVLHHRSQHYNLQRGRATSRTTAIIGLNPRRTHRVRAFLYFRLYLVLCLRLWVSATLCR